jgi:hypothetical protein
MAGKELGDRGQGIWARPRKEFRAAGGCDAIYTGENSTP